MIKYLIKRLAVGLLTLFLVSIVIFAIIHLVPGDPVMVMLGISAKPEAVAELQAYYGLDKPIIVQYFTWLEKIIHLDLGTSIIENTDIKELIADRLPRTIILTFISMIVALLVTLPLALLSARNRGKFLDFVGSGLSLTFISTPSFWLAIILIIIFSVNLKILPGSAFQITSAQGWEYIKLLILPSIVTGLWTSAGMTRMLRSEMIDNMYKDYILFVKVKGADEKRVLLFHNLRNSLVSTITVMGLTLGYLLGGVVIIEVVFVYPGMGKLLLDAIGMRDYPVIQSVSLIFAFFFIIVNLLTDIIYGILDPRISYQ